MKRPETPAAVPVRRGVVSKGNPGDLPGSEALAGDVRVPGAGLRTFRWIWAAFIILASSVPYLVNWLLTPAGFHYTWIQGPYPEDSLAYMAWSQQAAHGSWLFQFKYTALPHAGFLFNPFFLICGWITASFGTPIGVTFWLARAAGVGCFFGVFFRYLDYLQLNPFQSICASVLVGISSGFGGLLAFAGLGPRMQQIHLIPTDLWLVDSNTFWSLCSNPLFPYALTLMVLTIYMLDRGTRKQCMRDIWVSGFTAGILALIHPYSQPLLSALALIMVLVRQRSNALANLTRYFIPMLPFVLYMGMISELNPLASSHSVRGAMGSPSPAAYALGFGLPLLLAIAGLAVRRGGWMRQYWQIVLWFCLSLGLCYVPFWFQRKLIFGSHIPLCILAAISLDHVLTRYFPVLKHRFAIVAGAAVLLPLITASQIQMLKAQWNDTQQNMGHLYYVSDDFMQAIKYLRGNSKPDDIVFARLASSRLIPALSGNTVLWGHWAMSVDFEKRKEWVGQIFQPTHSLR